MGRVHRLKSSGCMDSLLKDRERIAASDNNTGGKIHGVVQTLNSCNRLAAENEGVAHGFHAENSDAILGQDRQHFLFETVEVGVHYVERHLYGIEREAVLCGGGQHLQMNIWTLVAGETDKTDLARFLASRTASIAPPLAKIRSGSESRITSWNCSKSIRSVCNRRKDSLI